MDPRALRLIVLGYITAVAIPPIGIVVGIVMAARAEPGSLQRKHGWAIIGISVLATGAWFLIFNSGVADTNSNDLS